MRFYSIWSLSTVEYATITEQSDLDVGSPVQNQQHHPLWIKAAFEH